MMNAVMSMTLGKKMFVRNPIKKTADFWTRRLFSTQKLPRVIETIAEYRALRTEWIKQGCSVGFVPTMGALHDGHLSLARHARNENDKVVASIFVNPSQFAPTEDLDKYPRTFESDLALLAKESVDVVLYPSVKEMYPSGIVLQVDKQTGAFVEVKGLSHQLEGTIRPHFFRGVATVVSKLLNITTPTRMYLGQKDGQQCAVLRALVRDLLFPTEIVVCDTMREHDGLAMSSRNRYLSVEERAAAPVLYRALKGMREAFEERGVRESKELLELGKRVLAVEEAKGTAKVEYLSVADALSLKEVDVVGENGVMVSGAVKIGKTRIIDNILLGVPVRRLP